MIDTGLAALVAAGVSLVVGFATPWIRGRDERARERRERMQRRAESYVELLRIVERRGLAVQDQAFNYTETEDADIPVKVQRRKIDEPPRSDRAEARALAVAYGTKAMREDLSAWIAAVEAWEAKIVDWRFEFDANGPFPIGPKDAEPEKTAEREARERLGVTVSAALEDNL